MIEKGLLLTGSETEMLSEALAEVKTRAFVESEASLDDAEALGTLVSWLRTAEKDGQVKETLHTYLSPLSKCLTLGTIISRQGDAERRES